MTRYNVTAWCDFPHYATFEVEAPSPAAALRKARKQVLQEYPEPNDGHTFEWNEFQIDSDSDSGKSLTYFDPLKRVKMAAQDLLSALERTSFLLRRIHEGDHHALANALDAAADADAIIAKAKPRKAKGGAI